MTRYIPFLLFAVSLAALSVQAAEEESFPPPAEVDGEGRTLGLLFKKHRGMRYAHPPPPPPPQPSLLGGLLSLFDNRPNYYAPDYYGYGYGNNYYGGRPYFGGPPVNSGGFYRPGFSSGYPGYQQYPGGYGGGIFRRDTSLSKDVKFPDFE